MAINSDLVARNADLELQNEKMRCALHGPSSERSRRLIDQMELEFEELEATATENEIAAQRAAAKTTTVEAFTRKRQTRREFPPDLPVERVVIPADKTCPCCGSDNLSKLGESIIRALETMPAFKAVQRIDRIFAIERNINGRPAAERQILSAPLVTEPGNWMREQRNLLSANDAGGKKMDYMLNAWPAFTAFLEDGRICLTNNAAERALRAIARGRKAWLFVGSDRGGERAAMMYTLIATCRLNDVDPLLWLTDVLTRIADISQNRLHELLPWNWKQLREKIDTAQAA